jgi:hypothetical protein
MKAHEPVMNLLPRLKLLELSPKIECRWNSKQPPKPTKNDGEEWHTNMMSI